MTLSVPGYVRRLITYQAVALLAKSVNLGLHPHHLWTWLQCPRAGDPFRCRTIWRRMCSISARMKLRSGMFCPAKCVSEHQNKKRTSRQAASNGCAELRHARVYRDKKFLRFVLGGRDTYDKFKHSNFELSI